VTGRGGRPPLEQPGGVGHTGSLVAHVDDHAAAGGAGGDGDGAGAVAAGVVDEHGQDLAQHIGRTAHRWQVGRDSESQRPARLGQQRAAAVGHVFAHGGHVGPRVLHWCLVACDRQQHGDGRLETLHLADGGGQRRVGIGARRQQRALEGQAQAGQRRVELVGHIGGEGPLPPDHVAQAPGRAVQRVARLVELGQPGRLIAGREVAVAQAQGQLRHPVHGAGQAGGQPGGQGGRQSDRGQAEERHHQPALIRGLGDDRPRDGSPHRADHVLLVVDGDGDSQPTTVAVVADLAPQGGGHLARRPRRAAALALVTVGAVHGELAPFGRRRELDGVALGEAGRHRTGGARRGPLQPVDLALAVEPRRGDTEGDAEHRHGGRRHQHHRREDAAPHLASSR
jgi:hypothetical protein